MPCFPKEIMKAIEAHFQRHGIVVKLQKARQNYINISKTDHTQARKLNLWCAGRECMEFRLKLHNLDVGNE